MDKEIICVDTSVFIDYFRKQRKDRTLLVQLSDKYKLVVSVITKLEIYVGIVNEQKRYWDNIFDKLTILPITENEIDIATEIVKNLKKVNKMIEIQDILIASTAISKGYKIATLNLKDFERIKSLKIIDKI